MTWSRAWIALGMLGAMLLLAAPAAGSSPQPFAPYSGRLPFRCEIQNVGTSTNYQHPGADPFCVEFDKTNQNVTDLGLVDFLSQEPARTAAASRKCFYFQRDHWTGSIAQGQQPELWHWDGDYFFDKALGIGGVSVHNLRVAGVPMDATPYAPDSMKPYFFGRGGGGAMVLFQTHPDPACAKRVNTSRKRHRVYRKWYRRQV